MPVPLLILASGSARRLETLRRLGFEPQVMVPEVPEVHQPGESPAQFTRRLAEAKARSIMERARRKGVAARGVVAADTVVVHEGEILGKPADKGDARAMLRRLSDTRHLVLTGMAVGVLPEGRLESRAVGAEVEVIPLDDDAIERYVATGEPLDKAGAYGIQGLGGFMVRRLRGSFPAVVGLPVCELIEMLERLDIIRGFPLGEGEPR